MTIANKIAKIASDLEKRGLIKQADELDRLLDELLGAGGQATDMTGHEPDAAGGTGPLPPAEMAADDGVLDLGADMDAGLAGLSAPVEEAPSKPELTPEQLKDRTVRGIVRKVSKHCEALDLFREIPRLMKEVKLRKESDQNVHNAFKLQAKRYVQCALEMMNKLCDKYHIDLSDHEKFGLIRKMGLEALDRSGVGVLKYDFVSALAEYKGEGHLS